MSVIVEDSAGDFWLYCKGADSVMFPLMISGKISEAVEHVSDFSKVCQHLFEILRKSDVTYIYIYIYIFFCTIN